MEKYENEVRTTLRNFKERYHKNTSLYSIPLVEKGIKHGVLRPIPVQLINNAEKDVYLQTKWRNLHKDTFFVDPFIANEIRTLDWLNNTYFRNDDRIIFMIEDIDGKAIGHLGFENFDYINKSAEYGRLMRGDISRHENLNKVNLIKLAQVAIIGWGFNKLKLKSIHGSLFANNWMVRRLHDYCGFEVISSKIINKSGEKIEVIEIELLKENYKLL